jgi:hypothetical protein
LLGNWEILRAKSAVSGDWTGEYKSPKDALVDLQKEVDSENLGVNP